MTTALCGIARVHLRSIYIYTHKVTETSSPTGPVRNTLVPVHQVARSQGGGAEPFRVFLDRTVPDKKVFDGLLVLLLLLLSGP